MRVNIIAYRQDAPGHLPVYMFYTARQDGSSPRTADITEASKWYDFLKQLGCDVNVEPDMNKIRREMSRGHSPAERKNLLEYYEKVVTQLTDKEKMQLGHYPRKEGV